jgi:hypothetical protein
MGGSSCPAEGQAITGTQTSRCCMVCDNAPRLGAAWAFGIFFLRNSVQLVMELYQNCPLVQVT